MAELTRMLDANAAYAADPPPALDARPARHVAVVTCMDARIDVLPALGLSLGDAHVIRNAGARVTGDVLRSLALSTHVLGVDTVVVMQHSRCGVAGATEEELRERTGADVAFHAIADHESALREDVATLVGTPYLAPIRTFAGCVYDVDTRRVTEVCRTER